jgi:hypothetical protein
VPGGPGGKIELVARTRRFTEVVVDGIDLAAVVASGRSRAPGVAGRPALA